MLGETLYGNNNLKLFLELRISWILLKSIKKSGLVETTAVWLAYWVYFCILGESHPNLDLFAVLAAGNLFLHTCLALQSGLHNQYCPVTFSSKLVIWNIVHKKANIIWLTSFPFQIDRKIHVLVHATHIEIFSLTSCFGTRNSWFLYSCMQLTFHG